jgi:hypothetical protein
MGSGAATDNVAFKAEGHSDIHKCAQHMVYTLRWAGERSEHHALIVKRPKVSPFFSQRKWVRTAPALTGRTSAVSFLTVKGNVLQARRVVVNPELSRRLIRRHYNH